MPKECSTESFKPLLEGFKFSNRLLNRQNLASLPVSF